MAKEFLGCSISENTFNEFTKAWLGKVAKTGKPISKSVAVEEAMLMFIKKYGVKK